jgi:uncharacterized protein (TIGR03435 family)
MTSWIDVAGWTLVHSVWQGAVIAALLATALRFLRAARPQARYGTACAALAVMLSAPVVTAVVIGSASRTRLFMDSIRLVGSPQGAAVGEAATAPVTSAHGATSTSVTEFPPRPRQTDTAFAALVTLWLAGVLTLLGKLAVGCWRVRNLQLAARLEPVSRWQSLAEDLAERLQLARGFSVIDSARIATPTVIGWLRPVVMLPVAAFSGLTPRQIEAILAHELAHIRRHDFIVNLLQTIAETVLFYHPAVWWVSRRIRTEREHCCDDVAVAVCGDAALYAAALTELASWSIAQPALAMAATHGPLISRVRRLLRVPEPADRTTQRTMVAVAVVLTALAGVGVLGVMLKAQPLIGDSRQFGPPAINQMLGFNLFPVPVQAPTDDPLGARGWSVTVGGDGRELSLMGFTARGVIREAYDLGNMPIVGVPRWMDDETFDLSAPADLTIADGMTDPNQVRAALQRLFEGSLGLRTHRESRIFPAYALVLANADGQLGPSLKRSTSDCVGGGRPFRPSDAAVVGPVLRQRVVSFRFCGIDDNLFGVSGVRVTMAELAREFQRRHSPLSPGREVVDRTALTDPYDFELRFGLLPVAAVAYAHPTVGKLLEPFGVRSVFTALPEQLGLKLVDATVSHEVLVIDQINRPQ